MSAPSSPIEICNMSLAELRQQPITNLNTPETATEKVCALFYDQTRRSCLRKHVWNFALKRRTLAPLVAAPAFGYDQAFSLPTDYIRLVGIGEYDAENYDYEIENHELLINFDDGSIPIRYIYDHVTIGKWDPLFIDVLKLELAIAMCTQLTGSFSIGERLVDRLGEIAPEAWAIDGQERPPKRIERSKFLRARRQAALSSVAGPTLILDED